MRDMFLGLLTMIFFVAVICSILKIMGIVSVGWWSIWWIWLVPALTFTVISLLARGVDWLKRKWSF